MAVHPGKLFFLTCLHSHALTHGHAMKAYNIERRLNAWDELSDDHTNNHAEEDQGGKQFIENSESLQYGYRPRSLFLSICNTIELPYLWKALEILSCLLCSCQKSLS